MVMVAQPCGLVFRFPRTSKPEGSSRPYQFLKPLPRPGTPILTKGL